MCAVAKSSSAKEDLEDENKNILIRCLHLDLPAHEETRPRERKGRLCKKIHRCFWLKKGRIGSSK